MNDWIQAVPVIQAKRGKGLYNILKDYTPHLDEERKITAAPSSPNLRRMMAVYRDFIQGLLGKNWHQGRRNHTQVQQELLPLTEILTPEEINIFVRTTLPFDDQKAYREMTGLVVSNLLQRSYDAGYNHFTLQLRSLPRLIYLGEKLQGTEQRPLELSINGHVGPYFADEVCYVNASVRGQVGKYSAQDAWYSRFHIQGYVRDLFGKDQRSCFTEVEGNVASKCGEGAEHSIYFICGKARSNLGSRSKRSLFVVDETAAHSCGANSRQSIFELRKGVGDNCGLCSNQSYFSLGEIWGNDLAEAAEESTFIVQGGRPGNFKFPAHQTLGGGHYGPAKRSIFKISNKEVLQYFINNLPAGNQIYYLHPGGREEMVRDYDD